MQSFRERSGFHGNQHCYQQEPHHESSRLEGYRHHHGIGGSHGGRGYQEVVAGTGPKDCYSLLAYPGYAGDTAPPKKPYKEGKLSVSAQQHLQAGYTNHNPGLGPAYPTQYLSEGHLQQKWPDSPHLPHYDQDAAGTVGATRGSQYLESNMLAVPQGQCPHAGQQSAPGYAGHHQRHSPRDASSSPNIHGQGRLHFPQHPQPLSSPAQAYMDKCSPLPHCYKGYSIPPSAAQYGRQLGTGGSGNGGLKPNPYRSQNSYAYPQPPSGPGYEQLPTLAGMPTAQDGLAKYQNFSQPQQSYCLSDVSVRSPEQYYQNCSPGSGHSPARSMGRSPSYSSTPSPLMVGSETFQYSQQPPIVSGGPAPASSSSSSSSSSTIPTGLQEQGLLMPPHSHTSQGVGLQTVSYAGPATKERFPEKLLSNPSLWSLNALTSQVESISNNVQQLLLSEALVGSRRASRRVGVKKGDDFKAQMHEDALCSDTQSRGPLPEAYGAPQPDPAEFSEAGYTSSSDEQLERSYYYCSGQSRSPVVPQAPVGSQHALEAALSCSLTSPDNTSIKSEESVGGLHGKDGGSSVAGLHSTTHRERLDSMPRLSATQARRNSSSALMRGVEQSPPGGVVMPSPLRPQQGSPVDLQGLTAPLKENFEESSWSIIERDEVGKEKVNICYDGKPEFAEVTEQQLQQQGGWSNDEKCPSLFHKVDKVLMSKSFPGDLEEKIYRELQNQYYLHEREPAEKVSNPSAYSYDKDVHSAIKSETYKSELSTDYDTLGKMTPFVWRDDLSQQDHYLSVKAGDLGQRPQLNSGVEPFEEKLFLVTEDKKQESSEEQHPIPLDTDPEERPPSLDTEEICGLVEKRGDELPPSATVMGVEPQVEERRFAVRDAMTPSYPMETVFPLQGEQAAPPAQARSHIDQRDAEVLEPDSPQLPGKSVLHPAPSWADTPPSPKKGDDDIEPGISCPSAVMPSPSAKSEPMAPSANLGALHRKHARGRRGRPGRPTHVGICIRGLPGAEDKCAPPVIASSKSTLLLDEMGADQKDLSGQIPKLSATAESFPSRMRTRSFAAQATPKACAQLKRHPGLKPYDGCPLADPLSHPKSLITKIKWMKQRSLVQGAVSHVKGKRGPSMSSKPDENQETPLLPTPHSVKDQKSMVLRSRKQTDEMAVKEKEKRPKPKETKKQKVICSKDQYGTIPRPNLSATLNKGFYKPPIGKLEEKSVPVVNKRKSSFQSLIPLKKQRWETASNVEVHDPPVETTVTGVRGIKRKLKRGEHLKASFLTKDPPLPTGDVVDLSSVPLQCPTKTKYLPPRKGRGLKYEAMVQKYTSPGSKKLAPIPQVEDVVQGDLVPKAPDATLQVLEEKKIENPAEAKGEEGGDLLSIAVGTGGETSTKAFGVGRRRGRPAEAWDQPEAVPEAAPEAVPEAVPEAASLIVNTPRLAKQRAIKNNHEMHMKQRRKRRKGLATAELQDLPSTHVLPPASTLPPDSALPTASTTPWNPALPICAEGPKVSLLTPSNAKVCKRGRPPRTPPAKRGRGKGFRKQSGQKLIAVAITVPKKKLKTEISNDVVVETVKKVHKLKVRHRKQCTIAIEEEEEEEDKWQVLPLRRKPQKSESEGSTLPFRPYVRIDSSKLLPSHCTIINRLEDDLILRQGRKKQKRHFAKAVTSPSGMPKATAMSSLAMLQGPLVNAELAGGVLTCCLCGKTANYRGLGDLCGPYYPENSIPRKALTVQLKPELEDGGEERAEERSTTVLNTEPSKKNDGAKTLSRRGRPRRSTEGALAGNRVRRPTFQEQYRRLRLLQGRGGAGMRKLQQEAESREHWAHETCIIWTGGVVLIAGKLHGLTEATRAAAQTGCSVCQHVGASISCCCENCSQIFHFVCAKDTGCLLQEDTFSLKCTEHKNM